MCANCELQFRVLTTSEFENQKFYQIAYKQAFPMELHSEKELKKMIQTSFECTNKDYTTYINKLKCLGVE
jgi:hypothetical protein